MGVLFTILVRRTCTQQYLYRQRRSQSPIGKDESAEVLVMGCGLTLRGATGSAQAQGGSSRCHQAGAHPPGIRAHLGLVLLPGRLGGPLGKVGGWALVSGLVWPQYMVHLCLKGGQLALSQDGWT